MTFYEVETILIQIITKFRRLEYKAQTLWLGKNSKGPHYPMYVTVPMEYLFESIGLNFGKKLL